MKEKIKIIEENIDYNSLLFGNGNAELSEKIRNTIKDLIKAYKETKQENKELSEANTKLAEENTKLNKVIEEKDNNIQRMQELLDLSDANNVSKDLEINQLNKVIDRVVGFLEKEQLELNDLNYNNDLSYEGKGRMYLVDELLEKYFREEVENNE